MRRWEFLRPIHAPTMGEPRWAGRGSIVDPSRLTVASIGHRGQQTKTRFEEARTAPKRAVQGLSKSLSRSHTGNVRCLLRKNDIPGRIQPLGTDRRQLRHEHRVKALNPAGRDSHVEPRGARENFLRVPENMITFLRRLLPH